MSKVQTSINASHLLSLIDLKTDCYYNSVTADFTPHLGTFSLNLV